MRLDPKYFNLFIGICAIITFFVILYSTFRYVDNQEDLFEETVHQIDIENRKLAQINHMDSLRVGDLKGNPVVIDFWATWSGKSKHMHKILSEIAARNPDLKIVAASVKDGEELIKQYISETDYPFIYVDGTELFHNLQVPGIPSQIVLKRDGTVSDMQVGEGAGELSEKIELVL